MMMGPRPRPEDIEAELHRSLGLDPADPSLASEKVVNVPLPPEAFDKPDMGGSVEVITPPPRKPIRPMAGALPPVDVSPISEPSPRMAPSTIDDEMAAARAADRNARVASHLQQASLDISGGLLNRDLGKAQTQSENNAGNLKAMRESAAKAALEARKVANESESLAQREKDRKENEAQQERFHADSMGNAKLSLEAAQANAAAMRELAKGNQGIAASHLKLSQAELDDKQKAKAEKEASATTDFLGGKLVPKRPGLSDSIVGKVKDDARAYSSALAGMDGLEQAIKEYVARPGVSTKNNISSRVVAVASALNVANNQGAMTGGELEEMRNALGASTLSPEGMAAVVGSLFGEDPAKAAQILLAKLNAARDTAKKQAIAKFSTDFDFVPGERKSTTDGRGIARNPKTGERRYINADGSLGEVVK